MPIVVEAVSVCQMVIAYDVFRLAVLPSNEETPSRYQRDQADETACVVRTLIPSHRYQRSFASRRRRGSGERSKTDANSGPTRGRAASGRFRQGRARVEQGRSRL